MRTTHRGTDRTLTAWVYSHHEMVGSAFHMDWGLDDLESSGLSRMPARLGCPSLILKFPMWTALGFTVHDRVCLLFICRDIQTKKRSVSKSAVRLAHSTLSLAYEECTRAPTGALKTMGGWRSLVVHSLCLSYTELLLAPLSGRGRRVRRHRPFTIPISFRCQYQDVPRVTIQASISASTCNNVSFSKALEVCSTESN